MPRILDLDALEILDSRGRPTLQVACRLASGHAAMAQVPAGASRGSAEACELRDGDPGRHAGRGCLQAAASVTGSIRAACVGREIGNQLEMDNLLIDLDGSENKARLGANAILGVSIAFARAHAAERGVPLYGHFADLLAQPSGWIPRPTINLFSGGKHAGGQVAVQDVLLVPLTATNLAEALAQTGAVYQAAIDLTATRYQARALVADEGGLAPPFPDSEAMLTDAVDAIAMAGFTPGQEFALAIDVAASHFYLEGTYTLDGRHLDPGQMIDQVDRWVDAYPILSVEDGLSEADWEHWPRLVARIGSRALVLGDDLLCTHPSRIRRAIVDQAANALLLKVNQIGTLSEAAAAWRTAHSAGWHITISARSGETEDTWLADLATGWRGHHIKIGSITRSERLAKYNRLLAIERETGFLLAPRDTAAVSLKS